MTDYYMTGNTTNLMIGPKVRRPMSVIREHADHTISVTYLSRTPIQPGQKPVILTDDERKILEGE